MSTNCIQCVKNKRTGPDLLCDTCRSGAPSGSCLFCGEQKPFVVWHPTGTAFIGCCKDCRPGPPPARIQEELDVQRDATRAAGAVCHRLERERDAALAEVAAMREALRIMVDQFGGPHEAGCPEDDTCGCPEVALVKESIASTTGQDLLDRLEKASEDTRRLDWLQANHGIVELTGDECEILFHVEKFMAKDGFASLDLRAAIDGNIEHHSASLRTSATEAEQKGGR